MSDQHSSPIKTPQQLIWIVALAFIVPIAALLLLASFVGSLKASNTGANTMTPEAIAARLEPVGKAVYAEPGGVRALQSGEAVYKSTCAACHVTGAAGAPRTGDLAQWAPRLKQGFDVLVKHAAEGFKAMPAKGGNNDLDPTEVARAVAWMGNQTGAKFEEPR